MLPVCRCECPGAAGAEVAVYCGPPEEAPSPGGGTRIEAATFEHIQRFVCGAAILVSTLPAPSAHAQAHARRISHGLPLRSSAPPSLSPNPNPRRCSTNFAHIEIFNSLVGMCVCARDGRLSLFTFASTGTHRHVNPAALLIASRCNRRSWRRGRGVGAVLPTKTSDVNINTYQLTNPFLLASLCVPLRSWRPSKRR